MWVIAKLSCKELLYKKIFLVASIMSVAFLGCYGLAIHYLAKEIAKVNAADSFQGVLLQKAMTAQFVGVGLYFVAFIMALLVILCSVGSIASEIESHQIDTVLARALRRRDFLLGKWIGLGSTLSIYTLLMFLGVIGVSQFFGGEVFRMDVTILQVIQAGLLFAAQALFILSVSLLLSSVTKTISSGIILIVLYGVSFIGGFVEQLGTIIENTSLVNFGIISSLIFPQDSLFRKMNLFLFDAENEPISFAASGLSGTISAPSVWMLVYAALYGIIALWWAVRIFSKRDL